MFHGNIYAKSNMFLFMYVSYFSSCIKICKIIYMKVCHVHIQGGGTGGAFLYREVLNSGINGGGVYAAYDGKVVEFYLYG